MKAAGMVLGVFALAALAPAASAAGLAATSCAPPCGYIFPTISVDSPIRGILWLNETREIPLTIIFEWDFDNDATGAHDASNPIELTFDVPKKPNWVDWSVAPERIVLQPPQFNPVTTYRYEYEAMLTLTPKESVALEDRAGTKMLLFVQSSESGTFKKSYGVEVFKFPGDGATNTVPAPNGDVNLAPGASATGAFAAVAAAAALLLAFRRKR